MEPRNPQGNYIVPGVLGDVLYRAGDRNLALDAYRQPGAGRHPAIIVVHGGNGAGSRVSYVGQLLETLTSAGYQWISIDYTPGHGRDDAAVDDVVGAIEFVRCHAEELGVDTARIALLGEDTGADLVARAALRDRSIKAVVLAGGAFGPTMPPRSTQTLVVHGASDSDVPIARASAWCAAKAASSCDLISVAGASHRVENWYPSQWQYKSQVVSWLGHNLGPGATLAPSGSSALVPGLTKNIAYHEPGDVLRMDVWLPDVATPTPAVILVHGGGWEAGDKVTYITPLFEPLAKAGVAWFSIDYRLTPSARNAEQIDDLRRAVAFVRQNATRFRIDPNRIVLIGESASGQMVSMLAAEDSQLAGVISFYGVYDFLPFAKSLTPRSLPTRLFGITVRDAAADALMRQYSPIAHVRRDMPPLLLIHGTADELWEQGQAMDRALTAAGAPHELYALANAPHGMENWEGQTEWSGYKDKVVTFVRTVTRPR